MEEMRNKKADMELSERKIRNTQETIDENNSEIKKLERFNEEITEAKKKTSAMYMNMAERYTGTELGKLSVAAAEESSYAYRSIENGIEEKINEIKQETRELETKEREKQDLKKREKTMD